MNHIHSPESVSLELNIPASLSFLAPVVVDDLIRVGRVNDGGYVVPEHTIRETDVLVSMGVNEDWSFDEHFKKLNPHVQIHAYDHTTRFTLRKHVLREAIYACVGKSSFSRLRKQLKILHSYNTFFKGPVTHFHERIYNRIDEPYDATITRVFERINSSKVFLKIDIEGTEYRIIDDILEFANRISGMVIEFHDIGPLRSVFCCAVKKLLAVFDIVHLHGNNYVGIANDQVPDVLELTFQKKKFPGEYNKRRTRLPILSVDSPNHPQRPEYEIRFSL